MKTLANRLAMFAASAVVLGTMAYGQTQMKAEIPFAFRTANGTLPPGSYLFDTQSALRGATLMILENAASHHTVFALGMYIDSRDRPSQPSVVFSCSANGVCSLTAIKTTRGTFNYPAPHKASPERGAVLSVVSIPATTRSGD